MIALWMEKCTEGLSRYIFLWWTSQSKTTLLQDSSWSTDLGISVFLLCKFLFAGAFTVAIIWSNSYRKSIYKICVLLKLFLWQLLYICSSENKTRKISHHLYLEHEAATISNEVVTKKDLIAREFYKINALPPPKSRGCSKNSCVWAAENFGISAENCNGFADLVKMVRNFASFVFWTANIMKLSQKKF